MLDFVLGAGLAALAVRGWIRGFVRELLDLVGLVVGAIIAFRLSAPLGGFLSDRFGVSPEWGRIGAGITLFILFGLSLAVLAHYLSRVANLPGLNLTNRLLGVGVAMAWGVLLLLVAVTIVDAIHPPAAVKRTVDDSVVVQAVAGPDSLPRRLLTPVISDRATAMLAEIERLSGGRRVVPAQGETIDTQKVDSGRIRADTDSVSFVADRLNADRLEAGVDPLTWSDGLAEIARERAEKMYTSGFVARRTNAVVVADAADRSMYLQAAGEMAALASSDRAAEAGIAEAPDSAVSDHRFDRVGVAVLDGPLGVLVVEVFGR
jgi:uncharacterized membrane protein required for colicin V production